jgi:hypothetical protein
MKLVCIGVGGTGAACLEATLHLAALGFFPEGCELVPVALDPDRQHPRIAGLTKFLADYQALRAEGSAGDLDAGGLFGPRLLRDPEVNALRPAAHEGLFSLLGLANPGSPALARLFFEPREIGEPDSHEFANGYYGRANAGVCFFSDPVGTAALLDAVRRHLLGGPARLVIFGSVFGGTGAAGLLHVARSFRRDPELAAQPPGIAVVQLESYFRPDASGTGDGEFVNLPETFERRTGAAYQFLSHLTGNGSLPFDALYPLGVREPIVFPPEWFRKDQQDNPHLFLEYLAALAARDFALRGAAPQQEVRCRRIALPPFGGPLADLRRHLVAAAATYAVLQRYVLPLLGEAGASGRLPGHPWIYDLLVRSGLPPAGLVAHLQHGVRLLREVLGHSGVLEASWRTEGRVDLPPARLARVREMSAKTRDSFPAGFVPKMEHLDPCALVPEADPGRLFGDYDRTRDALLPIRALARWALAALRLPPTAEDKRQDELVDYQLVQQEDQLDREGRALSLMTISDDAFTPAPPRDVLPRLERASWKSPPQAGARTPSEYPSVWAPSVVHREALFGNPSEEIRLLHLALLFVALAPMQGRRSVPVHAFRLDDADLAPAFRIALLATCPLAAYGSSVVSDGSVLALHDHQGRSGDPPEPGEVLAYFYPDTVLVPAPGLAPERRRWLAELGRFARDRAFPQLLVRRLANRWTALLTRSQMQTAGMVGPQFIRFLQSFGPAPAGDPMTPADLYTEFPLPGVAPWLAGLYQEGGRR